ncbi:uncharacterized protein PG986_002775 [Apiospora aurea]|uniref:Uncharacterized protein n=1 Tax=Apiospora aurea TaxID=335848 RepID=A0ABR1QPT3_9PEZI
MRTRKRPASADADEKAQESSGKHVKLEKDGSNSPATIPENDTTHVQPDTTQDTAMPDANSTTKQELIPVANLDTTITRQSEDLVTEATSYFQHAMANLRRHLAEKDQKILDFEALISQLKNVPQDNNTSAVATDLDKASTSNTAGTQLGGSKLNVPDLQAVELQDARKRSQEQDVLVREHEATAKEHEATKKEYEATIQEHEATIQALQQKWQQAETELEALKQQSSLKLSSSEDIDDKIILEGFKLLAARIKNMAKVYFSSGPLSKTANGDNKKLFDRIAFEWGNKYLKEPARKQYFIEAVIWHQLIDSFLGRPLAIWSRVMGENLRQLHQKIWVPSQVENLQSYHSLRVQLAEVFLQVHGRNGHYLGNRDTAAANKAELVNGLKEILKNYIYDVQRCQQELRIIVDKAVDLAYSMAMAKAQYDVRLSSTLYSDVYHGFTIEPASMRNFVVEDCEDEEVELVISPALLKFGTSEGEDYGSSIVLVRARVI